MLTPTFTCVALLEVVTAAVLCLPPFLISLPALVFVSIHLFLIAVQVVGSIAIRRLSPDWR